MIGSPEDAIVPTFEIFVLLHEELEFLFEEPVEMAKHKGVKAAMTMMFCGGWWLGGWDVIVNGASRCLWLGAGHVAWF